MQQPTTPQQQQPTAQQEPAQESCRAVVQGQGESREEPASRRGAVAALASMQNNAFLGRAQVIALERGMRGEEQQFFFDKITKLGRMIETMPKTYEQDGKGDDAVVFLHYFRGGMDWYITEKDMEAEQLQAHGLADFGDGGEMGYISIVELTTHGVELDLYFEPTTLRDIRRDGGR